MNLGFCLSCVAQNAAVLSFLPNELRASASFVEAQLKHDEKHQVMMKQWIHDETLGCNKMQQACYADFIRMDRMDRMDIENVWKCMKMLESWAVTQTQAKTPDINCERSQAIPDLAKNVGLEWKWCFGICCALLDSSRRKLHESGKLILPAAAVRAQKLFEGNVEPNKLNIQKWHSSSIDCRTIRMGIID